MCESMRDVIIDSGRNVDDGCFQVCVDNVFIDDRCWRLHDIDELR